MLLVVAYHADLPGVPGGFVGVDIFFVISGFLITGLIRREIASTGRLNFLAFYGRRTRRILPALFVTVVGTLIAGAAIFPPDLLADLSRSAIAAVMSVSNHYFWSQVGYFDTAADLKPLLHTWSLAVEEQFYLIWPVILVIVSRFRGRGIPTATMIAVTAVSLGLSVIFLKDRSAIYYALPMRAFELAIGGSLTVFGPPGRFRIPISLVGLGLIATSTTLLTAQSVFPSYMALVPCVGAALFIWGGPSSLANRLISNPLSVAIGKVSYSIYLIHWPVIVFYSYLNYRHAPSLVGSMVAIGLSLALATALYWFVEKPFRHGSRVSLANGPTFAAITCLALLTVGFGAVGWTTNGLPQRYPKLAKLIDARNQTPPGVRTNPNPCLLGPAQAAEEMPPVCYDATGDGVASILLIGDSTVERLYSGLDALLGDRAKIYVWTAAACPPTRNFVNADYPNCAHAQDVLLDAILPLREWDLVIAGSIRTNIMVQDFGATRDLLEQLNIPYVLLGAPVEFTYPLPRLIIEHGTTRGLGVFLADQIRVPCPQESELEKVVTPDHFFSLRGVFCDGRRPVVSDGRGLLFVDHVHMTPRGSVYLADRLVPWLRQHGYLPTT